MATFNWPGFGIAAVTPTLDQPAQVNRSAYTGVRAVASNPWHGKWSFKVQLATRQGDANFQAVRAFFTALQGSINNFHLPAVEQPQNANTGVTLSANAAQGASSIALTGVTTALVAGNMVTIAGQLLSLTSVGALSGSAQTVSFMPALRAAAVIGASVETAKPYALVALSGSSFTWDIGQWRQYGLTFDVDEDVGGTDGASPSLDIWTGGTGGSGGGGTSFSFPQLTSFISRSVLAAVTSPTDKQVAYLTEAGREGEFVFSTANLSASVTADPHQGMVVAPATDTTGASGAWRRRGTATVLSAPPLIPQLFYEATDPDFQAAMERARDYLNTFTLNAGGGGFYNGAPTLLCPAAQTYLMHERVDFSHTGSIVGEGDGWLGPGAGGCTHFKWTAGSGGFGVQATDTSGTTTVGATHNGSGGLNLRDMCLEGAYSGTEAEVHALVLRNAIKGTDLYLKNWPGEGVKAWAGTVSGFGNVGGNLSTARFIGVKSEGCRGAFDIRGSEANVISLLNCEGYQCRQLGYLDDNGAGSNTNTGMHCASNGLISNIGVYTQCSNSGNRYAAKWGGTFTNAPSGTTADTADWLYIEAGGAVANLIPAWASTVGLFRAGGDYLTINSASVHLDNDYSEGGGFSQFTTGTIITHGTIGKQYSRGGWRLIPQSDGLAFKTGPSGGNFILENDTEIGLFAQDSAGIAYGYLDFVKGGGSYLNSHTGHNFRTDGTTVSNVDASGNYSVGANKVIGARGAAVTDAVNAAAAPTQAEFNAFVTQFNLLLARVRASTGHGLIA